jgi:hypothetical protein
MVDLPTFKQTMHTHTQAYFVSPCEVIKYQFATCSVWFNSEHDARLQKALNDAAKTPEFKPGFFLLSSQELLPNVLHPDMT